ncbi:MAG: hypothetical protein Q8L90_06135 [Bacteroidota bacterium]|nr:hypothetical protein [Bacteroidota bacterium]
MAGIFIVFKLEQAQVRKEIKHQIKSGLPENDLHSFVYSKKEYEQLDWVRKNIEFRLNNEMFDIVRSENKDDTVLLYCVNDKEETLLFAQLDEMIRKKMEQESNSSQNSSGKFVKFFKFFNFILPQIENKWLSEEAAQNTFSELIPHYLSPYIKVSSPPPDTV